MAFIGDSVTRFHYFVLNEFLRTGQLNTHLFDAGATRRLRSTKNTPRGGNTACFGDSGDNRGKSSSPSSRERERVVLFPPRHDRRVLCVKTRAASVRARRLAKKTLVCLLGGVSRSLVSDARVSNRRALFFIFLASFRASLFCFAEREKNTFDARVRREVGQRRPLGALRHALDVDRRRRPRESRAASDRPRFAFDRFWTLVGLASNTRYLATIDSCSGKPRDRATRLNDRSSLAPKPVSNRSLKIQVGSAQFFMGAGHAQHFEARSCVWDVYLFDTWYCRATRWAKATLSLSLALAHVGKSRFGRTLKRHLDGPSCARETRIVWGPSLSTDHALKCRRRERERKRERERESSNGALGYRIADIRIYIYPRLSKLSSSPRGMTIVTVQ